MHQIFSTDDVHPRDRFDYWQDVANERVVEHGSKPHDPTSFAASLHVGKLADVDIVNYRTADLTAWHTQQHARRSDADALFICRSIAGKIEMERNGIETVLDAGSMMLLDPRAPYSCRLTGNVELTIFKLPRRELESRLGDAQQMIAHPVAPTAGIHGLASAALREARQAADALETHEALVVQNQLLDLVALSLAKAAELENKPRLSSARSFLLMRLREAVKARLADATLDVQAVADMVGISTRHANAVLANERLSLMQLIIQMRLARCEEILRDPCQAHRSISEIAFGCGFVDATHFGRRFKATYGLTPRAYREAHTVSRPSPTTACSS